MRVPVTWAPLMLHTVGRPLLGLRREERVRRRDPEGASRGTRQLLRRARLKGFPGQTHFPGAHARGFSDKTKGFRLDSNSVVRVANPDLPWSFGRVEVLWKRHRPYLEISKLNRGLLIVPRYASGLHRSC